MIKLAQEADDIINILLFALNHNTLKVMLDDLYSKREAIEALTPQLEVVMHKIAYLDEGWEENRREAASAHIPLSE